MWRPGRRARKPAGSRASGNGYRLDMTFSQTLPPGAPGTPGLPEPVLPPTEPDVGPGPEHPDIHPRPDPGDEPPDDDVAEEDE
jgi:hypothetical protein